MILKRLESDINEGRRYGEFRQYAIVDEHGNPTWPGKYPDQQALDDQKKKVGDEHAWAREYLLTIIPDVDRPIQKEWIQYYDEQPEENSRYTRIAVDLAISERDTADFTAIIPARIYGYGDNMRIYILPYIFNQRLTFPNVVKKLEEIFHLVEGYSQATEIVIEDVGYQAALHQWLQKMNFPARGYKIQGQDKHARLKVAGYPVQNGTVLFPRKGAEQLIQQLIYFGIEKHDDLADAFSILVNDSMARNYRGCRVFAKKPPGW